MRLAHLRNQPPGSWLLAVGKQQDTSLSMSNFSYKDPVSISRDSQSIVPWAVAAILHCPELQLQGPLSLWAGTHSQRAGCTFLLITRSGPVPQVLLANTSGIHSRARRGAAGGRAAVK